MEKLKNQQKHLKTLGIILRTLAPIGILYLAFLNYYPKSKELTASITGTEILSGKTEDSDIKGYFEYKDSVIENLYLLNLDFSNTGKETLIGTGNSKNILKEGLEFSLQDSSEILFYTRIKGNEIGDSIQQVTRSGFQLNFDQWKPNESVQYKFYLSKTSKHSELLLASKHRGIINGEIKLKDYKSNQEDSANRVTKNIYPWIITIGKIGITIGLLIGLWFILSFYYIAIEEYLELKKWKKMYFSKYEEYAKSNYDKLIKCKTIDSDVTLNELINNPSLISNHTLKKEIEAEEPPMIIMSMTFWTFILSTFSILIVIWGFVLSVFYLFNL